MSQTRGAAAESAVCTWALELGWDVLFPARGLSPSYDMVIRRGNTYQSLQVKRAYPRVRGEYLQWIAELTDRNQRVYDSTITHFAIVSPDLKSIWVVPAWRMAGKKSVTISSSTYDGYKVQ